MGLKAVLKSDRVLPWPKDRQTLVWPTLLKSGWVLCWPATR